MLHRKHLKNLDIIFLSIIIFSFSEKPQEVLVKSPKPSTDKFTDLLKSEI